MYTLLCNCKNYHSIYLPVPTSIWILCLPASPFKSGTKPGVCFLQVNGHSTTTPNIGQVKLALHYDKRALQQAQANGLHHHQAEALIRIAKLLPKQDADTSLRYLDNAMSIPVR